MDTDLKLSLHYNLLRLNVSQLVYTIKFSGFEPHFGTLQFQKFQFFQEMDSLTFTQIWIEDSL